MTASEDLLDSIDPIIHAVSSEFGRRHRIHGADAGDFYQELALWALENKAKVGEWLDPDLYSEESGIKMLAKALRNAATDYGEDIKAQATGVHRDDVYWYSKGELRALLPCVYDPEKWLEPPRSDGRSSKSYSEGGNWVTLLADVSRALTLLETEDRQILERFHRDNRTNRDCAEYYELSEQVMSYRHDRAVGRLLKVLGGPRPKARREVDPFVGRRSLSNAQAVAMTKGTYDDE